MQIMAQPYDENPPSSPPPFERSRPAPRRTPTWPALFTLYILSPVIAEMLTGSTPPLMFINPIMFVVLTGFYGSSAILVREVVRRRGLGWGNILLLGAAYGILEEGLVVMSWFNPYWSDLGKLAYYGRLFDTSWVWAVELTIFHAVVSITIPILLTELIFPHLAHRPWLRQRGLKGFTICLVIVSLIQLVFFGFLLSRSKGFTHPPLMYIGALLLAIGFVWAGLNLKPGRPVTTMAGVMGTTPGLWKLRLAGFAATFTFFFTAWILPFIVPFPIVPILIMVGLVILATRKIARWSRRAGWSSEHSLALASGVIGFIVLLSPLVEFVVHPNGKTYTGMALVDLAFLVGLMLLARTVGQRSQFRENLAG
jgi:hypothetical protein